MLSPDQIANPQVTAAQPAAQGLLRNRSEQPVSRPVSGPDLHLYPLSSIEQQEQTTSNQNGAPPMPSTWQPHQAKQFARQLQLGKPYYVIMNVARNVAPYEDPQLYSEMVFTRRLPLTRTPCTEYGSDAETWCQLHGPVYDAPPRGIRNVADAPPQVSAPLGSNDYRGYLDEAELRGLEKHVRNGSDPRTRRI